MESGSTLYSIGMGQRLLIRLYPLVNDHIAGWNITILNRGYIDSIRVHFPASYARLPGVSMCWFNPPPTQDAGSSSPG